MFKYLKNNRRWYLPTFSTIGSTTDFIVLFIVGTIAHWTEYHFGWFPLGSTFLMIILCIDVAHVIIHVLGKYYRQHR